MVAARSLQIGMLAEKVRDLGLDRLGQQSTRPLAQDFGELIVDVSWLNQLDDVIFGHGISLLRWRSGGVKHPHDMPPSRFPPSPTFSDSSKADYAELSELGRYYIGGLLTHAWALCGLCAPTTNSYRRLVPGYEAPINLVYSQRNRSACCRIPMYSPNPRAKRVEFRSPDPSCNPYLAFAAMLMAGLDGIMNRIDPGSPIDKNLYDLPPAEAKDVKSTPGSLDQALDALERDHAFLLRGDVFTRDVIETWLDYKRKKEVDAIRLRPHPHEFHLYYDI